MLSFAPCTSLDITDEVQRAPADRAPLPECCELPSSSAGSPPSIACSVVRPVVQGTAEPLFHYVVLRGDLPIGDLAAQTIHAAGESARQAPDLPEGTHAVALAARDEDQLLALERALVSAAIPHRAIREPDAPFNGALLAIGIAPSPRALVRPFVKKFPLVGGRR